MVSKNTSKNMSRTPAKTPLTMAPFAPRVQTHKFLKFSIDDGTVCMSEKHNHTKPPWLSDLKNPHERERESQFPLGSLIWRDEKEREVQKPNHTKPTKDPPLQPCENHWVKPSLAPSLSHRRPQIFGLLPPRRQPIEADNTCNLRVYNIYTRLKGCNC